jgi:hypothetical protein
MLNLPLVDDRLAMRLVVTDKFTDGWITRYVEPNLPAPTNPGPTCGPGWPGCTRGDVTSVTPAESVPRVNTELLQGGRVELLAQPSDALKIDAMAIYQRIQMGGYNEYYLPPGITNAHYQVFNDGESIYKATVGLRWYKFDSRADEETTGLLATSGNATPLLNSFQSSNTGVNPKATLSYEQNHELTLYGTIARGFRPGGINQQIPNPPCTLNTETYGPDSIWNYEVGEKAKLLDNRLIVNADVYYIKWTQVQQSVNQPCGYPLSENAGTATSYGPEIEVTAVLTPELTMSFSGTYTHATLTSVNTVLQQADSSFSPGLGLLNVPKLHGDDLADLHKATQRQSEVHGAREQFIRRTVHGHRFLLRHAAFLRPGRTALRPDRIQAFWLYFRRQLDRQACAARDQHDRVLVHDPIPNQGGDQPTKDDRRRSQLQVLSNACQGGHPCLRMYALARLRL